MRIRAWHPESGNQLRGEVVERARGSLAFDYLVIPDGLLESVLLRGGPWVIQEES